MINISLILSQVVLSKKSFSEPPLLICHPFSHSTPVILKVQLNPQLPLCKTKSLNWYVLISWWSQINSQQLKMF